MIWLRPFTIQHPTSDFHSYSIVSNFPYGSSPDPCFHSLPLTFTLHPFGPPQHNLHPRLLLTIELLQLLLLLIMEQLLLTHDVLLLLQMLLFQNKRKNQNLMNCFPLLKLSQLAYSLNDSTRTAYS